MALWGKGMVLYREKKDYAGAREIFEKLLNLMPPGEERNEIAKVLPEIPAGSGQPTDPPQRNDHEGGAIIFRANQRHDHRRSETKSQRRSQRGPVHHRPPRRRRRRPSPRRQENRQTDFSAQLLVEPGKRHDARARRSPARSPSPSASTKTPTPSPAAPAT